MTEYRCKRGFKIDIPEDKCNNEEHVSIIEPEIRAFCAFCDCDGVCICFDDDDDGIVAGAYCVFLRADLLWDDWKDSGCYEEDEYGTFDWGGVLK